MYRNNKKEIITNEGIFLGRSTSDNEVKIDKFNNSIQKKNWIIVGTTKKGKEFV